VTRGFHWLSYLVAIIAVLQGSLIALFAAFALSGDSLGIARAMALGLSLPFAFLTLPALVMLRQGRPGAATITVLLSVPATWAIWFLA
jgi:hypothetical protein